MTATKTTTGSPIRLRKRELFRSIGYEPHPGQLAVHRSSKRYRILACGARWGKSTCAAMEIVAALLWPCESSHGWTIAPTFDLTLRIVDQVRRVLHTHFAHRIEADDARGEKIVVRNLGGGVSTLNAKSADNPISLLGEGLDWMVVDEAAKLKAAIWESYLAARLIDRRGWALLVSTPNGINWFHKLHMKGRKQRDPAFESWRSPSWTNPHLDPVVIAEERGRLSDDVFAQEFAAKFLNEDIAPCEKCGWPALARPGGPFIVNKNGDIGLCPLCNGWVDAQGRTIMGRTQDGRPRISVIDLRRSGIFSPDPAMALARVALMELATGAPLRAQ